MQNFEIVRLANYALSVNRFMFNSKSRMTKIGDAKPYGFEQSSGRSFLSDIRSQHESDMGKKGCIRDHPITQHLH